MLALSKYRSLRQDADAIDVGQSALSRRLRSLEDRLGVTLFERDNGGSRPTVAGLEFLAAARRILDESDALYRKLKSHNARGRGRLTIGIRALPATGGNVRSTLIDHHRCMPDVDVHIHDGDREHLLSALTTGIVDIAVITGSPRPGMIAPSRSGPSA